MNISHLYKYRPFNDLSVQMLKKQELYFSRADNLNDPYEVSLPITFDGSVEEIRQKLESLKIPPTNEFIKSVNDPKSKIRQKLEQHAKKNLDETRSTFGICSFSEVNNDILLWAHYADCHKGFCLEFDVTNSFFLNPETHKPLYQKVKYPQEIPTNNYFKNTPTESVFVTFLNKYSGWSYEKEWRVFATPGCHAFEPECLTGIIFGYRQKPHERDVIYNLISQWKTRIKYYEVKLRMKGEFGLVIAPIN